MSSIPIRWTNPGNAQAMAAEVKAAYMLRIKLMSDDGEGITTPEALAAEEKADAMDAEFTRIFGAAYTHFLP
ncbi:hypothetical protein ACIRQF_30860 [Streptomyces sp. NPDC101191]|uniref:hypothetical protein n=1 Tax=Streptomyces sp. NPDC101191 TaxID=3366126 RepID=UPI00382989E7